MNLVLAGTPQEYHDYASKVNKKCKQVSGMSDLRGLHGLSIVLVGSYADRADWDEIDSYLDLAYFDVREKQ